jgi:hypothetical protein
VDKATKIDEETDVKTQAVKAAKTMPYAKSKLGTNTWALTIKIKTSNKQARHYKKDDPQQVPSCLNWEVWRGKRDAETDTINNNSDIKTTEGDQIVEAIKTRQSAKSKIAVKSPSKFENVE